MKTAEMGQILNGDEPVLVTREGRLSGVYLPLKEAGAGSDDPRWELISLLERYISETLEAQGVTEEEIQEDFNAFRRLRR
jgi:hypothetical protein